MAILNWWGKMRSWMAFTVAHALPNKQTYSYYGILESLSGMRVNVRFISFDDVLEHGVADDIDVIINGGPVDTAFTGGDVWKNPKLTETLRAWVRGGGAFVGVGEPSSLARFQAGRFFQLADVLGVDEERYQTLSVDKYFPTVTPEHFITADVHVDPAAGEAWEQAGYRIPLSGCGGGQGIKPLGGISLASRSRTRSRSTRTSRRCCAPTVVRCSSRSTSTARAAAYTSLVCPTRSERPSAGACPVLGLPQRGQVHGIQLHQPRVRGRGVPRCRPVLRDEQHRYDQRSRWRGCRKATEVVLM